MTPDPRFVNQPLEFWANVRTISERLGYRDRDRDKDTNGSAEAEETPDPDGQEAARRITRIDSIEKVFLELELTTNHLWDENRRMTEFGQRVIDYLSYREQQLRDYIRPNLMVVREEIPAKLEREELAKLEKELAQLEDPGRKKRKKESIRKKRDYITKIRKAEGSARDVCKVLRDSCSEEVKTQLFSKGQTIGDTSFKSVFNRLVNGLIIHSAGTSNFDRKPNQLTTFTHERMPLRTLGRRVDGAFPRVIDPVVIWEVKEYYTGISFGSRISDGIYETMLDGAELRELRSSTGKPVRHYYMADGYYNFWVKGRSYLCRAIDMLHMGYVHEVLFGYEVVDRIPQLVPEWIELAKKR